MKNKIISTLFALFLSLVAPPLSAAETTTTSDKVNLAWNPVTETGGADLTITGYRVYFGKNAAAFTHIKEVTAPTTTATIELPDSGKWFIVCTAINSAGIESVPSNMLEYTTVGEPGTRPGVPSLRIVSAVTTKASTVTTVENVIRVP